MKRILATLCTLAMLLSVLNPAVFAAENSDLQAAMGDDSSEIIVLEEDTSNLTVNRDTTIDLNGHDLTGVSVLAGTLYIMDSATADYTVADGVYGHVTNVTGAVKAADGYLQVGDSFHAVNLDIYAMTLRASDVGVYYKSHFAADEIVAAEVESFGVALSVVTAPSASNLETYCGYSAFTGFAAGEGANVAGSSTLLKGIMKAANGDEKNVKNAAMPVYGRAYIKTGDGYFFGETVKRSLQEQVEAIDGVWETLSDAQKAPVLSMLESYTAVMESWNIPNIQGIQVPGADTEIQIPIEVTAENGIVTETTTVEQNGVSITVPAGTKLAEGAESLTLTVTPVEAEDTGLTLKENYVLTPMDVHVEGLAADNAQPLTIYLGKVMPENLNMGNYAVYHVENGKANEMTLIPATAEFTAHNQYKYTLDGELTLYMASFSPMGLYAAKNNAWQGNRDYSWYDPEATELYIRNADQLAGFGAIVGGMDGQQQDSFSGKTVILLADINIGDLSSENGYVFYPIGYYNDYGGFVRVAGVTVNSWFKPFAGTFDGNGNTISDFYQNTWEMFGDYNDGYGGTPNYYREGMGLFGKVYGGTIKNLIVKNYSCDSEHGTSGTVAAYADCGATFENIAIFDCNPRVYNIANGGIVGCAGWYAKEKTEDKVLFKNITVDNSNTIAALWDATGTSAGGILGQYYPNSGQTSAGNPANPGVHFEGCRISAVIEVNNDCCSNYHYYWYRYAGMLMGSVRANKVDEKTGYTMADTTGITAANCEVNYGYWNEYWYCELVKNTIASYTHDHQFGRLTSITDISQISADGGETWLKEGNFALLDKDRNCVDCYHIFKNSNGELYRHYHDQPDETNPNIYEDFDLNGDGELNDLKEDRQRYYIPFGQLLTGDGMGVLAHYEFEGVTVKEKDQNGILLSQEKFVVKDSFTVTAGEWKLSEIFELKEGTTVNPGSVQAYISPVGNDSTIKPAACVISDGNWENGILSIMGNGAAKITITDYWYCTPTTVNVTLNSYTAPLKFKEGTNEAYCPACDKVVAWKAIGGESFAGISIKYDYNTKEYVNYPEYQHTYLAADINYQGSANNAISYDLTSKDKCCLHLNGKNITASKAAIYGGCFLNIMGSGTVQGGQTVNSAGGTTLSTNSSNGKVHVYGGTWKKTANVDKAIVGILGGAGYATITLYKDVIVDASGMSGAAVSARSGNLNIQGATIYGGGGTAVVASETQMSNTGIWYAGTVNMYSGLIQAGAGLAIDTAIPNKENTNKPAVNISGGKILGNSKVKPTSVFTVSGAPDIYWLTTENNATIKFEELLPGANIRVDASGRFTTDAIAEAEAYQRYIVAYNDAKWIKAENGHLYCQLQTYTDNLVFKGSTNAAYCVACKKLVTWTPITQAEYGTKYLGDGANDSAKHFYLAEDFNYKGDHYCFLTAPSSGKICCFHLNGYDLSADKAGLFFGWPGTLNIMGSGLVTGARTKKPTSYSGSAVGINTNNAAGVINVYSGTFASANGYTNNSVIAINENGGKINVYKDVKLISVDENVPEISILNSIWINSEMKITGADLANVWLQAHATEARNESKDAEKLQYGGHETNISLTDVTMGQITVGAGVKVVISGATKIDKLELADGAILAVEDLTENAEVTFGELTAATYTITVNGTAYEIPANQISNQTITYERLLTMLGAGA